MLTLILAESALETVPKELWGNPAIKWHSKRRGKPPEFLILDRSYHHVAMKTMKNNEKRGRPDIVHFSLLEALGSPLNKEGLFKVYVHTINDQVISVSSETRLPKNYIRFIGLLEQLFQFGKVPQKETPLLVIEHKTLSELINTLKPSYVVAFSRTGQPFTLEETVSRIKDEENPAVIIGGFSSGHFKESTKNLVNAVICVDPDMLEAWVITSRLIYEFERALSIPKKRITRIP